MGLAAAGGTVLPAVVLAGAVALALGGCGDAGFHPLYGSASFGGGSRPLDEKFAQLDVAPIPGRVGQRIRNELIFQATGGGKPLPPVYRLEIATNESVTSTLVKLNGDAEGSTYNIEAKFRVVRVSDKAVVLQGTSYGRAAFERFESIFANVRAREDAENRAAETVAFDLKSRLAAFLGSTA